MQLCTCGRYGQARRHAVVQRLRGRSAARRARGALRARRRARGYKHPRPSERASRRGKQGGRQGDSCLGLAKDDSFDSTRRRAEPQLRSAPLIAQMEPAFPATKLSRACECASMTHQRREEAVRPCGGASLRSGADDEAEAVDFVALMCPILPVVFMARKRPPSSSARRCSASNTGACVGRHVSISPR